MSLKPTHKPACPLFSSGPTRKHPGWSLNALSTHLLGRSHRSSEGIERLQDLTHQCRQILQIPDDYKIALMQGSATGTMESALWSFLGPIGVDVFAWDVFGRLWLSTIQKQLKISDLRTFQEKAGRLADLSQYAPDRDTVFTWNGTATGVCVPNSEWISPDRTGLVICDATSAVGALKLDWTKLDVTSFSWQKAFGAEATHGMLVLSPRALDRLKSHTPAWPVPRLFRLTKEGVFLESIFEGLTINTPSMLCVEDISSSLLWAEQLGGLPALLQKTQENASILNAWVQATPWVQFMAEEASYRSPASVCMTVCDDRVAKLSEKEQNQWIQAFCDRLNEERAAYDIRNHRLELPSFRIWCGPTVEKQDLKDLTPWLDWAFQDLIL